MSIDLCRLAFEHPELADLDAGARRLALRALVGEDGAQGPEIVARLSDEIDGFGRLTALMSDETVSDILVNGPNEIWSERCGALQRESVAFDSAEELYRFIDRVLATAGEHADSVKPVADAKLQDGSRLHVALPPVAPHGPLVSIRRFSTERLTMRDLIAGGTLTDGQARVLTTCVIDRKTIVISGGTGTGKTTLLNALLASVPSNERVILIEETPELEPTCAHHVSLIARAANEEGRGAIDLASLLRASLRMRPDRIVVGEVRGQEALVALSAMSTGHPGSLLTVHASSAEGARRRLLDLGSGIGGPSESALTTSIATAVDVWVHLGREGARRRVVEILHG